VEEEDRRPEPSPLSLETGADSKLGSLLGPCREPGGDTGRQPETGFSFRGTAGDSVLVSELKDVWPPGVLWLR